MARIPADSMLEDELEADVVVDEDGNPIEATEADAIAAESDIEAAETPEGESVN